jgi:hypothetical protein
LESGRFAEALDLPIGWSISFDNEPNWSTKLDANILVGAAALNADFLKRAFLCIEEQSTGSPVPLRLSGNIEVSGVKDFNKTRRISLRMSDFLIERRESDAEKDR